ncbi:MAG: hypothetical protein L3J65_11155 [Robiginitomaculum sp.]|nr:hypothetical protein [Robiginitomaculum sp.]
MVAAVVTFATAGATVGGLAAVLSGTGGFLGGAAAGFGAVVSGAGLSGAVIAGAAAGATLTAAGVGVAIAGAAVGGAVGFSRRCSLTVVVPRKRSRPFSRRKIKKLTFKSTKNHGSANTFKHMDFQW